jgi:hypothetical protein
MGEEMNPPVNVALYTSLHGAYLQAKGRGRQFPENFSMKFFCGTGRFRTRIQIIELTDLGQICTVFQISACPENREVSCCFLK